MNKDKKEKYIEYIVSLVTLLFFAFLSMYAMRGCSSDNSLSGGQLVSYLETGSVTTNNDDKKDEVQAMNEADEADEDCDSKTFSDEVKEDVVLTQDIENNVSENMDTNVSEIVAVKTPVVQPVTPPEVKTELSKEKNEAEEEAGIIADIEKASISKSPYVLKGVSFKTGSSILTQKSKRQLDTIANALKKHNKVKVNLRGHTDKMGSQKDNEVLSSKRANSVGFALVERGVDIKNIWTQGMGELDPLTANGTAEEMARNRRVDIAVIE